MAEAVSPPRLRGAALPRGAWERPPVGRAPCEGRGESLEAGSCLGESLAPGLPGLVSWRCCLMGCRVFGFFFLNDGQFCFLLTGKVS